MGLGDVEATYQRDVVPLHDQTRGEDHGPEHGLLVLPQRLADGQLPVLGVALLRAVDELDDVRVVEVEGTALALALGRDDLLDHVGDTFVVASFR